MWVVPWFSSTCWGMSGAMVGISQLQLLPSLDSRWRLGGFQKGGWPRVAGVSHTTTTKGLFLLKALEEEKEGRKLCVKLVSNAC